VAFILPTIYGLLKLASTKEWLYRTIAFLSIALQLYFFYHYAIAGTPLYNNGPGTWLNNYSIFYFPLHTWLPMLYDPSWAYSYIPNYAWTILVISLFCLGFIKSHGQRKNLSFWIVIPIAFTLLAGFLPTQRKGEITFQASDLPSQTGRILNLVRVAQQNLDSSGFVNFGPYLPLRKGQYELKLKYKSASPKDYQIADFDIYDVTTRKKMGLYALYGTDNKVQELKINFKVRHWSPHHMEFRTKWNGAYDISLYEIELREI